VTILRKKYFYCNKNHEKSDSTLVKNLCDFNPRSST